MAKYKESPRYRIVSVRVSDEERDVLERISLASNRSVSELMREALQLVIPRETVTEQTSRRIVVRPGKQATPPVLRRCKRQKQARLMG